MLDDSTSTGGPRDANVHTRRGDAGGLRDAGREGPLGPREAFLVAYERLALLAQVVRAPAFIVAAVDARAQVTASLLLHDGRALILGRHSQCGLRIEDTTVALRHVAVLVRGEAGRPVLHVRDLGTEVPFVTEDGSRNAGVMADGPLYIAVGSVAVWFLPCPGSSFPARADEAWSALAPRTFLDRRAPEDGMRPAVPAARSAPRARRGDGPISVVTSYAPPLLLGDDDEAEIGWGTVKLISGAHRVKRSISAERLEQGILVGRYGRCSLMIDTAEGTVSRVHVLLVRLGMDVWVIDTASTNGVQRGDDDVLASVLRDVDTLTLGRGLILEWARIQHAEA
jgi:hypothetical protein